jgi:anaerobic selenocysteine-containing dehydrogenase
VDAVHRRLVDGDAVALVNERGHVGLRARVTTDAQRGVAVVENQRNRSRYLSGGPLNVLTSDDLSDMGAGATYQSTWVDARPLAEVRV